MGLIDNAQPQADVLEQARQKFEALVPEGKRDALDRVVTAGKKILYSKDSHAMVEKELAGADPVAAAGTGAADLMGLLVKESRGTMPKEVVAPAMMILLTDVLDYLKQTGRAKGDAADLDTATQSLTAALMKEGGVDESKMRTILDKAQASMKDPAMAAKMKEHMGGQYGA